MAFVSIIFFGIILFTILLGYALFFKNSSKLMIIAILFILTFLILLAFTTYDSIIELRKFDDFQKIGPYGDYIGGILNPLIAVFGVFAAGFAFYAQYDANRKIQEQFKIQQFETRLFKMLDIYNINVENLKFISRKKGNNYSGKVIFPHLVNNFNSLKNEILSFAEIKQINVNNLIEEDYLNYVRTKYKFHDINNFILLEITYIIFLYGVGVNGRKNIYTILNGKYKKKELKKILNYLSGKPVEYNKDYEKYVLDFKNDLVLFTDYDKPNNEKFDKYYNGHQNNLAHYFRHIFMIIKYINNQDTLSYNQKWEYSKLLRTQMSNHEQELFFLNSISIVGREWELNHLDDNIRLITKYDLIKNISKALRDKYNVEDFYPDVVYEDYARNTLKRENLEKKYL